jgi:hypothetical protein
MQTLRGRFHTVKWNEEDVARNAALNIQYAWVDRVG